MAFKYAIVLTGSIATGKSSTAKIFHSFGFTVIDADTIAHTVLNEQYVQIAELFGDEVRDGAKINRKVLGEIVFSDKDKRTQLESFLHPLIYEEIERRSTLEDKLKKPYLIDIPLFFETNRYPIEKSLVVYTPKEIQLKRLMQRDGYNEEDALSRIATQIDIEQKKQEATYVIDNSKDLAYLNYECARVKNEILGDFK
jgi:dephospho-CoA kinase